jgi:alpha-glucosidase (family GH31 glycosyl hydrolase)
MYPEITPLIRDTIKRRYEIIPYLYSLMLESHLTALPPQRWTGHGYESDPAVWTAEVMSGETQYWLGDTLLVGGVYEPGKSSTRMYLPRKEVQNHGYINLNEPHQYLPSGQWVEIHSEWRTSIPLLARVGGTLVVGKNLQTRSPGDHRHSSLNVVEDDYRAVEIFPPSGTSGCIYSNTWCEDDGISARPEISSFTVRYSSTETEVIVDFESNPRNKYVPLWYELSIILPMGDIRKVVNGNTQSACSRGDDSRGRAVFTMPIV